MEFKTYIKSIKVYNAPNMGELDNYVSGGILTASWSFEVDSRSEGIKDISIGVQSITGLITINKWTEGEDIETEIEFDSKDFEVENGIEIKAGAVRPEQVEIDFKDKTILIY